jgi:uncharacterized protein (TIGR03118 family)
MSRAKIVPRTLHRNKLFPAAVLCCLATIAAIACSLLSPTVNSQSQQGDDDVIRPDAVPIISPGSAYRQINLISDVPGLATLQDPLLVNPWGISATATSPFWIANNGTSTTQLFAGDVSGSPFVLNANPQTVTIPGGLPTGTVASGGTDFVVPGPCAVASCPARFLFASITGNITGWSPNAPAAGSTQAVIAASNPGHVYTGLTLNSNSGGNRLYAADFANGKIDVYTGTFALTTVTGNFADPTIPNTSGNVYHPFNIQSIGSSLYVTYAKVGADGKDEEGVGNGFVRRFNTDGVRDLTFGINNGALNSPWGVVLAPPTFGIFGGALLIGNFGEGNPSIHAYNPTTGAFLGTLQDESGNGIVIDELWALRFGNGGNGGDVSTLYFSAGIGEEEHGLLGSLKPTTASATSLVQFSTDDYSIGENSGVIDITVTRNGNASGTATVNYATFDESQVGHASQKSDYIIQAGTLIFNAGETSKVIRLQLEDDLYVEGDEKLQLYLSNPTGTGVGLGSPNVTTVTILDNDILAPTVNPLEDASFFVRQQYLDFLNRRPDQGGLTFWTGVITGCGSDPICISNRRVGVSASFFIENEFQQTGYFVYREYKVAFGTKPLYGDYVVGHNLIGAGSNSDKATYSDTFVLRPDFRAKYPTALTNTAYVDALLANTTINDPAFRTALISGLDGLTESRASVLRKIAEHPTVVAAEFNTAFVLAEYFGYLRRDPDTSGFNFWINALNSGSPPNFRGMVCNFITSSEYQQRFSSLSPRTNGECANVTPGEADPEP